MSNIKIKPLPRRHVVIGTAGHIDHGKTELVKLLTGCDTDRLPEEKRRGMSIELGFAPCKMWSKQLVGIVDVPGHEKFVRTMVAGAAGMDFVMLVVAADDGIMPQTIEHMQIMTLLGVRRGLVALTKIDRVGPERIEQVTTDLRAFLKDTFLADAAICPISPVTGDGYDSFWETLNRMIEETPERGAGGLFRMSVLRVFSVQGYGTVVTGVPCAGTIRAGDAVELLPARVRATVRDIQVYQMDTADASAGECAALNVHGVSADQIERGHVIGAADSFEPATGFALRAHLLPTTPAPLKSGAQVQFHTGTSETPGRVYLLDSTELQPGQSGLVQIRLDQPIVALPGDHYIIRLPSPVATVAGGVVLESVNQRLKPHREAINQRLLRIEAALGDVAATVLCALDDAGAAPVSPRDLAKKLCLPLAEVTDALASPALKGKTVSLSGGRLWMSATAWEGCTERLLGVVRDYHAKNPLGVGIARTVLSAALELEPTLFEALTRAALERKIVAEEAGALLRLADFRPVVSPIEQAIADAIEGALLASPMAPPSRKEVSDAAEAVAVKMREPAAAQKVQAVLKRLIEQGIVVAVGSPDMIFHRKGLTQARHILIAQLLEKGEALTMDLRDRFGVSRKYAVPLLDFFDHEGLTLRVDNRRRLRETARRRLEQSMEAFD